tara:strand:- start:288 stop:755 length:468 start_codon:yes stop_codon:yes gene_type:complete
MAPLLPNLGGLRMRALTVPTGGEAGEKRPGDDAGAGAGGDSSNKTPRTDPAPAPAPAPTAPLPLAPAGSASSSNKRPASSTKESPPKQAREQGPELTATQKALLEKIKKKVPEGDKGVEIDDAVLKKQGYWAPETEERSGIMLPPPARVPCCTDR